MAVLLALILAQVSRFVNDSTQIKFCFRPTAGVLWDGKL